MWRPRDLNRGQIIGVGRANIVWPGLSAPILRGKEIVEQVQLPPDPEREAKIFKLRDSSSNTRAFKLNALDRGWSGNKMPGRSIGPPDPIGEDEFEGFDTKVIEYKQVFIMKGNLGRKRRLACFVVTGNKNGLAGFAWGKSIDNKAAMRKAKNRAGQKLIHFDPCNGHTIYHDFFSQFSKTKIFAKRMPEGTGLICHRAIRECCQLIGIKDIYAKLEGSTCTHHIVKAFFVGLLQQKSHQQLAEDKKLLVVEQKNQTGNLPRVVAIPAECRKSRDIGINEVTDLTQYALGDRVVLRRKKFPPFYERLPHWQLYLKKREYWRNKEQVRLDMKVEYGDLRSFLTDTYPECRPYKKPKEEAAEEGVEQ